MPDRNYQREARRVDTIRVITDDEELSYWNGYRLGIADAECHADPEQRERRECGYSLRGGIARHDSYRAVTALGYWDGRRWRQRSVRYYQQWLTVDEWLEYYGALYGVTDAEHARQMCRRPRDTEGGSSTSASLPYPWRAEHQDMWFITT